MTNFNQLASTEKIQTASRNFEAHNIHVVTAETGENAKKIALDLIPEGAEVMTATSTTLDQLGLTPIINDSGKYNSVKSKLMKMNRATQGSEMQKLGAAPDYIIGSVHAVTEDGKAVIASGSGSQLPGYSYGAQHVIWLVSTKKIVSDLGTALKRIYEHVLPQEDARMKKVYGPESGSSPRKILIVNEEMLPNRTTLIFVKEPLGF